MALYNDLPNDPPIDLPADLPVAGVIGDVAEALKTFGSAVLVAPPGAGKTTLVPLRLITESWLDGQRIVMLEPRRLAARAAGRRMANLLGEEVGETVGYQTRDERRIGRATRIEVVTEGILTRRLQHDPELPGTGLVIFDEIHERNLPTDVGLAFALDARRTLRPDLRLLAMSATAQAQQLAALLAGPNGTCPTITSEGRMHPIDLRWSPPGKGQKLDQAVTETVLLALRNDIGDILVFLPGIGEITRVYQQLESRVGPDVDIYPLAGALSLGDQDKALNASPAGRRRVVLSTDIAETSLTVAGVRIVVDAGQARVPRYDIRTGMTRLTTVATSRASADQRAGRAGRTEPGVAYRLWSKLEHSTRRAHLEAEITQVDLAGLALELAAWGTTAADLDFPDPPPARTLTQGIELLQLLGAFDADGRITEVGRAMLAVPAHPRLARMVVEANPNTQALACIIAALLDDRDILRGRADDLPADLALRLRVVLGRERHERADRGAIDRLLRRARDIAGRVGVALDLDAVNPDNAGAVLLLAYPDRLAVRRGQPGQFQLRTGAGAWVAKTDPLAFDAFVVAADVDGDRKNTRIRLAAAIEPDEVASALGSAVETRSTLVWDKDRGDIVERLERRLGNMKLDEHTRRPGAGEATTAALIERVRNTRLSGLNWTAAATQLRQRVNFARHHRPDDGWPDWSDGSLVKTLDVWLAPYLNGMNNIHEVAGLDLTMVLRSGLPWVLGSKLDEVAPANLELTSGRTVVLDYGTDRPNAHVRVQDLFGTAVHPTAAGVAITLHLLSPADRPIQITSDLPGFWAGSWSDVRKEMAGRYPKHQWPTDPAAAIPHRLKP